MSGKVTNAQINTTTINVDEFRKAVNYQNPKNKGYVRFEPDGKGGVKLAKINNKIDMFLSWRTNIDADKNRAMREKFVAALTTSLKWADQTKVDKIAMAITQFTKGENKGKVRTDALSRKELQAAFKSYDKLMNTTGGRQDMINRLLENTAERCGLVATDNAVQELKHRFFPQGEDWKVLMDMQDSNPDIEIGQPGHMKMDELAFKSKLHALELKCENAVKRAKIENLMRAQADAFVGAGAINNDFGLHLSIDEKAQLRGALLHFLNQKGLVPQNEDGGIVGTGGMVFEAFIDNVLPELFKKNVTNIREAGDNADAQLQMEANFSFDAIMEEAEKFMVGARDYINNPPKADVHLTGNAQIDGIIQGGRQLVTGAQNTAKAGYMQTGLQNAVDGSNMTNAEAGKIMADMKKGIGGFEADGLLRTYTQKFLAERGIGEEIKPSEEKNAALHNTLQSILDTTMKVGIAAKLQHGSAKIVDGKKEAIDSGMGGYVKDMEEAIGEIASGKDGLDKTLMGKLFSCTLANIASRKVELVANGVGNKPQIDKASEAEDRKLLESTAKAYVDFEKKAPKAISGAEKAFEKVAKTALKKGLVTQDQFNEIVQRSSAKFANAHKAALHEFFLKSPVEDAAEGTKMLQRILKAKIGEANAELNNDLNVMSLGRTIGVQLQRKLLSVEERIKDALAQPGLDEVKVGRQGIIDEQVARARLAAGPLKRLYTQTVAAHLKSIKTIDGHRTLTDKVVNDIVKDFNSKAASLLKSVSESETKYLKECSDILKEDIKNNIENEAGAFKGYMTGPAPITDKEKKDLMQNLADETLRYKASAMRGDVGEIIDAPESFAKKDVKALAKKTIEDFVTGGPEKTMIGLVKVVEDRTKMVTDFLKSDDMVSVDSKIDNNGVFGKGGALENAGPNEKGFFINKARKTVKARMEAMPLVYATGDKEALVGRVVAESLQAAEKSVKAVAGFRKDFLKQCKAIEADFAGMGEQKLNGCRDWVLMELMANAKDGKLDLTKALAYYRNFLQGELNYQVGKIRTSFSEYVAKVDKALEAVKAKFNAMVGEDLEFNKDNMTAEAFQHLTDNVIPAYLKNLETAVYRNPDDFAPEKLAAFEKNLKENFITPLYLLFDDLSTKTDDGLRKFVKMIGAGVLLNSETEKNAAFSTLKTWLASTEGHQKLVACEKALLDHLLEFGSSYNFGYPEMFAPKYPGNPVAEFRFAARDLLRMHTAQMLYVAFDNDNVGEAMKVFENWVDSHALSRYADYRNTTAKDKIMQKFNERVKFLQEAALKGAANEPILTPSFITLIDHIIDSTGVEAMIGEWKSKAMEELQNRYLKKDDEIGYIFDPDHPRTKAAGECAIETAKENRDQILTALSSCISSIAGKFDSRGGLDEVREAIFKIDMKTIIQGVNDEVNFIVEECNRRYAVEEEINKLYSTLCHSIERQFVRDAVGEELSRFFPEGLNDLLSTKVGMDKKVIEAVGKVKSAIINYLADGIQVCRKEDFAPENVGKQLMADAAYCVDDVKKDEVWKGTLFSKGVLPTALKNAARELQAAEQAQGTK